MGNALVPGPREKAREAPTPRGDWCHWVDEDMHQSVVVGSLFIGLWEGDMHTHTHAEDTYTWRTHVYGGHTCMHTQMTHTRRANTHKRQTHAHPPPPHPCGGHIHVEDT